MDCRFRNSNQRARDHEALLGFQRILTWFHEDACGDNKNMVVGGIGACKLVMHSGQYPILCENLLAPKIRGNNVAMMVLFDYVHGI